MVQIIPATERKKSFGERLGGSVDRGVNFLGQMMQQQEQQKALQQLGVDPNLPPEFQKLAFEYGQKANIEQQKKTAQLQGNRQQLRALEIDRGLKKGELEPYVEDVKLAEQITRPAKEKPPLGGLGGTPLTPEEAAAKKRVVRENPNASAEELEIAFEEAGLAPGRVHETLESRRKREERIEKSEEEKRRELRKETLPIRTVLAQKAESASKGIQNKEQLLELIEKGDINDPTFAALAESLPLNLGKRMLSNDTVEYKAGLVEEFTDLRNIFQGQTRIKEIDLLENKIADIYLTDSQKKAIMRSRINALKADQIRAEAAAEIEDEPYGVLQFNKEVEKRAKPKLEALFNQVLDEQKAVIKDAENRKNIPLDINDPEDKKVMQQILKEAGGDKGKALQLAKKKGYSFR